MIWGRGGESVSGSVDKPCSRMLLAEALANEAPKNHPVGTGVVGRSGYLPDHEPAVSTSAIRRHASSPLPRRRLAPDCHHARLRLVHAQHAPVSLHRLPQTCSPRDARAHPVGQRAFHLLRSPHAPGPGPHPCPATLPLQECAHGPGPHGRVQRHL